MRISCGVRDGAHETTMTMATTSNTPYLPRRHEPCERVASAPRYNCTASPVDSRVLPCGRLRAAVPTAPSLGDRDAEQTSALRCCCESDATFCCCCCCPRPEAQMLPRCRCLLLPLLLPCCAAAAVPSPAGCALTAGGRLRGGRAACAGGRASPRPTSQACGSAKGARTRQTATAASS